VLSILIWWAIPAVAVVLAALTVSASRRLRARRADADSLEQYQRARKALERTQRSPER
jgi:cytochrome c-type biogenesis protein CcmH/NrfF